MALNASIDQIASNLHGWAPHWLPAYDLNAYAAKVDAECEYGSDMMVAIEVNAKMFEEVAAFVQLCGAFASLNTSVALQYMRVHESEDELGKALEHSAASACQTYTELLELLVDRGILVQRTLDPPSSV
ncbi:hypothetical protein [Variovorax guangxiensis]|uniref:Uncharacterized protein n=1 Tax=Variovorax guangxiensis TaxID=1775474 RepID=A0A840FTI0_9BURK|nr:hypothetical protein [Variovorax guangxiensis]MBB4225916.1 hypothetical protein [Variovorax guangxiensis]